MWHGLAKEFAKRGHEVTILARAYPGQPEHENSDGIRIVRWGGYDQGTNVRIDLVKGLVYALGALGKVPAGDVVVTNDFWLPILLPRLRPGVGKVVASIARFPKGQFWLYHGVDRILAVSAAVAEGIRKQTPGIAGKVGYIPNCVDEAFLRPREDNGYRISDIGKRQLTVLFVGRIHPEKGLDVLLEAWKRLGEMRMKMKIKGDVRLRIVGPWRKEQGGGGEEYLESLKRKAEGVEWGEPVFGAEELAKVYDNGDILVYPSQAELGEAMPLAPLEGMARGLPVVVSNLEVFKEYLVEGQNGWAFNHRESAVENLAAVLGSALNSDLTVMGQEARRTAERFSVQKIADMYLEAFKDMGYRI
jgi:glycosyltransferase involved in cell wall biosynthesis